MELWSPGQIALDESSYELLRDVEEVARRSTRPLGVSGLAIGALYVRCHRETGESLRWPSEPMRPG